MSTGTLLVPEYGSTPDIGAIEPWPELDWEALLNPQLWLGHVTPPEFLGVSADEVREVAGEQELEECFRARLVSEHEKSEAIIRCLLGADVTCMSHALSALLSMSNEDAKNLMPGKIRRVIGDTDLEFDHIGVEIFGKLEWYIELFDRAFAPLGINVVGEHVFPSVQVKRALQYDPALGDVRIGRIFFEHDESRVNLEVFEATQSWEHIALRQAALYAHLGSPQSRGQSFTRLASKTIIPEPVGHVAYRVPSASTVESIQSILMCQNDSTGSATIRPYVDQVFFNPADNSANTKFVVSTQLPSGREIDSQIIEVISYDN